MQTRYAEDYRKLIALARDNGADVALATATMSVNASSPREVKDFYGAVFKPIDDIIAANAAHNRMVNLIAREEGAPLIDMAAGVDGQWDDDLYLDIVHFTEGGDDESPASCSRRCCRSWRSARACAARCAERAGRGFAALRQTSPLANDVADAIGRDAVEPVRSPRGREAGGIPRRGPRRDVFAVGARHAPSMIVDHFNPVRASFGPDKADAPLLVDANAELSRSVSLKGLQPIPGRRP